MTVPIVRAQYRLVPVGEFTPPLSFLTGGDGTQFEDLVAPQPPPSRASDSDSAGLVAGLYPLRSGT
ncbi:hypothetical protein W823_01380 [Williamsia sp. D3]|nr:hypothetical protein W823_01380 [Williamsia sp. D3]